MEHERNADMTWTARAKEALRSLYQQSITIRVRPRPLRLDARLAPHYKEEKARARERAESFAEVDEMLEWDDAGLTLLFRPCYCQGGPLCSC